MLGQLLFGAVHWRAVGECRQVTAQRNAPLQVAQGAGLRVRFVGAAAGGLGRAQLGVLCYQRCPVPGFHGLVLGAECVRFAANLRGQRIIGKPGDFGEPGANLARANLIFL